MNIYKIVALIGIFFFSSQESYSQSLSQILEQTNLYTVKIQNSIERPFTGDNYGGSGTGFLVNKKKGLIVTNAHVSGFSPAINRVNFKNKNPVSAKQVYIDKELDFAILQIDPKTIPSEAVEADMECKLNYKQGDKTVAFGHPYDKDFTITRGIISGIRFEKLANFESIQTDTPINPGNSGGPLISEDTGKVVGISTFGLRKSQGLNFAIPSIHFCKIIDLFEKNIDPSPLDFEVLFASNDNLNQYLKVSTLLNQNSKFKTGDLILKAENQVVTNPTQLATISRGLKKINLDVLRDGKTIQLPLELKTKGSYTDRIGLVVSNALIGQKFSSSLSGIAEQVINADNHLVVQSVEAGLASGIVEEQDIILKVDGRTIKTVQELKKYLEGKKQVELILRSLKNFGDKVVFFDRYESLEIKKVEYLQFK